MDQVEVPERRGFKAMVALADHQKNPTVKKKTNSRILLLSPPLKKSHYENYRIGESLGIGYIASYIEREGHIVKILEPSLSNLSLIATAKKTLREDYDIIGFSVHYSGLFPNVAKVIKYIREAGFKNHITLGGHFSTFEHIEILKRNKNINSVIRNEGEITLLELACNLGEKNFRNILGLTYRNDDKICINPPRPLIKNLDEIPFPKRNEHSKYQVKNHFTMITSRGCYGNCSFCSVRSFYDFDKPLWRYRSPRNVVDEVAYLVNNFDAKVISFMDDNFIGPGKLGKKRAIKIANEIINKGLEIYFEISCRSDDIDKNILKDLKKAGLRHISIGIESGNNNVLKRFNKKTTVLDNINAINTLRRMSLSFTSYFIMFDPFTTINELRDNLRFLNENRICTYRTVKNAITIYKGTPFYSLLEKKLKKSNWEYQYDFEDSIVAETYYTINSLRELNKLDSILDVLAFNLDIEKDEDHKEVIIKAWEIVSSRTNEFVYDIVLEIIESIIKDSLKESSTFQMENVKKSINDFVERTLNELSSKGLEGLLKEIK